MNLDYSRISTFTNCGYLYKIKHVEKIPGRPKPYLELGSTIHATLRTIYTQDDHTPSIAASHRIYRKYWYPRESYKIHYSRDPHILEGYYKLNIDFYHRTLYLDGPFEIPIVGHTRAVRFDGVGLLDDLYV